MCLARIALVVVFGATFIILCSLFFSGRDGRDEAAMKMAAKNEVGQLANALSAYHGAYGKYPEGNQAAMIEALAGKNEKKVEFIKVQQKDLNAEKELADPWGTPYQIEFVPEGAPHVSSAGPNQKFDAVAGSDDIRSWSSP